jgi:hypothetical protein
MALPVGHGPTAAATPLIIPRLGAFGSYVRGNHSLINRQIYTLLQSLLPNELILLAWVPQTPASNITDTTIDNFHTVPLAVNILCVFRRNADKISDQSQRYH